MHLQEPQLPKEDATCSRSHELEVEKISVFTRGLLAIKPEHQQLIVDAGAPPHLVALLKKHKDGQNSRAVNGANKKASDAITNLAHENGRIKTLVRLEGGIPPLVELLESPDAKVQRAAAGALLTLAFKNDENKTQTVECNALPTLVLMLRSEDTAIHYRCLLAVCTTEGVVKVYGFPFRKFSAEWVEVMDISEKLHSYYAKVRYGEAVVRSSKDKTKFAR